MKTVAKICIKHDDMYTMFDGHSNMYFGQTNIPLNEGDHVLIQTDPCIKILKKLTHNETLWAGCSNKLIEEDFDKLFT